MGYSYRYVDHNGNPALQCPECGTRWDVMHGITLETSDDGLLQENDTLLDSGGDLVDVYDLVRDGLHSCTRCGDCGEMLINMEGVFEEGGEHE